MSKRNSVTPLSLSAILVSHLEKEKLPEAREAAEKGKAGYTTSAGTPYSAKEVMDEWTRAGEAKKEPTTTVEKLVAAALKGQSSLVYIGTKEGITGKLKPVIYRNDLRQSSISASLSRTAATLAPPNEVSTSIAGHSRE